MTKVEFWNLIVASASDGTMPGYRGSGLQRVYFRVPGSPRKRCVWGLAIPDCRYHPSIESAAIADVIPILDLADKPTVRQFEQLRYVHDQAADSRKEWEPAFFLSRAGRCDYFSGIQEVADCLAQLPACEVSYDF